jgi:hypothetical protein
VRVQDGEPGVRAALDEHCGDAVAPGRPRVGHLERLLLSLAVLPFGLVVQKQFVFALKKPRLPLKTLLVD